MSKYLYAPDTIKEECRCGHHKASHHHEAHACLGVLCECTEYRDRLKPPAAKAPPPPPSTQPSVLPDLDDYADSAAWPSPYSPTGTPYYPWP